MTSPKDIGTRIRAAREEQGWTQDQLAAAVGVSRSAVAQWETGRAGQVTTNLTRVAGALGIGVEHLMYGRDKLSPGQPQCRGAAVAFPAGEFRVQFQLLGQRPAQRRVVIDDQNRAYFRHGSNPTRNG